MFWREKRWRQLLRWGTARPSPLPRRVWPVLIAFVALLLMGFYSVTNPEYLPRDPFLYGADWLGGGICHRLTPRSFVINGRQLPLCARCTGMYLGTALVFLVLGLAGRWRRVDLPPLPLLLLLVGLLGLMGIDGINSYTHFFPNFPHLYTPKNWLRLLTGMGAGLTMGLLVFPALMQTLWREAEDRPIIDSFGELGGILLLAGVLILLALSNQPLVLYVLAIVSVVGVVLILAAINGVLLLVALRRDGIARGWGETAVPLTISILLALSELIAIAWLRMTLTGTITGFPGF
jgi:uncharacterized membrane protein